MKGIFDCNELKQLKASPFRAYLQPITKSEVTSCGCIVYGAGQIAKELLFWLKRAGVTPICIVDRNLELSGTVVDGIAVYPPEELLNHKANVVIIIATCYIRSVLMCNPFLRGRRVVAWTAVHQICPVVPEMAESVDACIEDENVSQAYALLADESSKKLFKDIIKFHLTFDEAIFSNYDPDIYFPADLPLNHHCFIDVGAYNGDTLKRWLNHGFPKSPNDRYYAFEPNPAEFVRIQALTAKLPETTQRCVELCNMGLGAEDSTMHLSVTDVGKTSRLIDHQATLGREGGGRSRS